MKPLRIAVLDATHGDENARRNFRRELAGSTVRFDVTSGELPEDFAYDAAVVTGSRSSVYWDEAWIPPTKAWVRDAIDRGLPFLGICWGHQLLADVLGGEVRDMGAYEIGYREIERAGDSRLFEGVDDRFTAFTTHTDEVAELPPGSSELAANDYSNHGFRKDRVFGVQFHPEYDKESARDLTMEKELAPERRREILDGITDENYEAAREAKQVFDNFHAFVREVRSSEGTSAGAGSDAASEAGAVSGTGGASASGSSEAGGASETGRTGSAVEPEREPGADAGAESAVDSPTGTGSASDAAVGSDGTGGAAGTD